MSNAIKFHLDQHVSAAVARGLRRRGIDVTTTAEANLQDADDTDHLDFALAEGRVVFTMDSDFLRFHHQEMRHAGIVFCRPGTRSIGEIVHFLELLHFCVEPDEMVGELQYF